jgi:predicted RNA-binding Zn ribbon-like protein
MPVMAATPDSISFAPEKKFRYVGGDPSLDLINTTEWTNQGLEKDRLSDYARLMEWAEGAGVLKAADARRLRSVAEQHPRSASRAYQRARQLRVVLQRVFSTVVRGVSPGPELHKFNVLLAGALAHGEFARINPGRLAWTWRGWGDAPECVLWPVVRSAAALLESANIVSLRICELPECGWMYLDHSRNGLRRWCQMDVCGTKEKTRRRRERTRRRRQ